MIEREWLDEKFAEIEQDMQQHVWEDEMSDAERFERMALAEDAEIDRREDEARYEERDELLYPAWMEMNGEYDSEF